MNGALGMNTEDSEEDSENYPQPKKMMPASSIILSNQVLRGTAASLILQAEPNVAAPVLLGVASDPCWEIHQAMDLAFGACGRQQR